MDFRISVVIPVYNAEKYLTRAVESAVVISEVDEVLLVEDQSPDDALKLCIELSERYEKVKCLQHPDKRNHGAGASRNLGIINAKNPYIAFLDADDYYLKHRFEQDLKMFLEFEDCDGVYNAVGTEFNSRQARDSFYDKGFGYQETLTLTGSPAPDELFSVLFNLHPNISGQFHTNGITIKKELLTTTGLFNTQLRLRQDIHLWRRLAAYGNLYPGELVTPVSNRVIHDFNRMTVREDHEPYIDLWWKSLNQIFKQNPLNTGKMKVFSESYTNHKIERSRNKFVALRYLLESMLYMPELMVKSYGSFDFNFWKVFGKNRFTLRIISFKNRLFS